MTLPSASLEVPPEDVERMLKKIWREAVQIDESRDSSTEHQPRLRTALANLVLVLSPDKNPAKGLPTVTELVNELISDLCVQFPSRFFLISFDDSLPNETLKTAVSSRCVLGSSGHHVCSEEISVSCGRGALPLAPSLLRSLFIPDVPIVSLILGDPTDSSDTSLVELLKQLGEMCDLFLYDSKLFRNYQRAASFLASLRKTKPSEEGEKRKRGGSAIVRIRDLQWYRTERFRMLLAERFDGGRHREIVPSIKEIKFTSAGGSIDPTSLLLGGWICAALGWKIGEKSDEGLQCTTSSGAPRTIAFVANPGSQEFSLSLKGSDIEFAVEFNEASLTYETSARFAFSEKMIERRLTVPKATLADLIALPMQSSGINDYFTRSLERSIEIVKALT